MNNRQEYLKKYRLENKEKYREYQRKYRKNYLSTYEKLQQENQQLKDNWIKLKEIAKSQSGFKKRADLKGGLWFEVDDLLDKMQELERSDNQ